MGPATEAANLDPERAKQIFLGLPPAAQDEATALMAQGLRGRDAVAKVYAKHMASVANTAQEAAALTGNEAPGPNAGEPSMIPDVEIPGLGNLRRLAPGEDPGASTLDRGLAGGLALANKISGGAVPAMKQLVRDAGGPMKASMIASQPLFGPLAELTEATFGKPLADSAETRLAAKAPAATGMADLAGDAFNAAQLAQGGVQVARAAPSIARSLAPLLESGGKAASSAAKAALPAKAKAVAEAVRAATRGVPAGPVADEANIARESWLRDLMPDPYGAAPADASPGPATESLVPNEPDLPPSMAALQRPFDGGAGADWHLTPEQIQGKTPVPPEVQAELDAVAARATGKGTTPLPKTTPGRKAPAGDGLEEVAKSRLAAAEPAAAEPADLRAEAVKQLERGPDMPADVMAAAGPPPASKPPIGYLGHGGADELATRVAKMPSASRVEEIHRIAKNYGADVAKKVAKLASVSMKLNPL